MVAARMKKTLRKKVESVAGAEGGTRQGKEVRRGLGGTRRISPLQRILSALHLFQDVVFPLRRESHTPSPLESPVSFFSAPSLPPRLPFSPPIPRCPPRLPPPPSPLFASNRKSHLPMRFGDGKLKILSRLSPSYFGILRILYNTRMNISRQKIVR